MSILQEGIAFLSSLFKSVEITFNPLISFKPLITKQDGKEVVIQPEYVFEVAYEEIQKSPTYSSGYALRFPRLVRVREDKGSEEADNLTRVQSFIGL